MLKNVEPARFTRADANLDVLDHLVLRRFAGKARRGEAKALERGSVGSSTRRQTGKYILHM
jgi:hypothetical protein